MPDHAIRVPLISLLYASGKGGAMSRQSSLFDWTVSVQCPPFAVNVPDAQLLVVTDRAELWSRRTTRQTPQLFVCMSSQDWLPLFVQVIPTRCIELKQLIS